jgi:hypothetical protein
MVFAAAAAWVQFVTLDECFEKAGLWNPHFPLR